MLKGLGIALGAALAIALIGVIPLMGIPGALVFGVFSPLADLVYGRGTVQGLKGDTMWPIAILMTWLWPLSIPAGYLLAWGILPRLGWRLGLMVLVMLLWGLLLTLWMVGSAKA